MAIKQMKNIARKELDSNDLVIFADLDEMLSREVLHQLKYCELKNDVLSAAITMPMGNFNLAFRFEKHIT